VPQGGRWKVYAILLTLIAVPLDVLAELLRFGQEPSPAPGVYFPMMLGGVIGILLLPLLFVLVARIFARPYTPRSFWKAYAIGMALCAIASASQFMTAAGNVRHAETAAVDPVAAWTPYLSAEGGYRVEMPGIPEPSPIEGTLAVRVKLLTADTAFVATHVPMGDPQQNPLEVYALTANGYRSKGIAVEDSAIFHADVVARELDMRLPNGHRMLSRLYVAGGVVYEISVGGPDLDEEVAYRYLDSFERVAPQG
jgi:hypothetical protein